MTSAAVAPTPLSVQPPCKDMPLDDPAKVHPTDAPSGDTSTGLMDFVVPPTGSLNLTDEQKQLVEATRQAIDHAGISTEDIDDRTIMRYLVARCMKPDKAAPMYVTHRKWRAEFVPSGDTVPESEIPNQLASDMFCLQTLPGHMSWLIIRPCFHDTATRNLDEFVKFIVYSMDKSLASLPPDHHKFGVIIDMAGLAYRNMDTRGLIAIIQVLQNQFPERLVRLFFLHVPYLFWSLWKLISTFIDPYTKKKFCFVEDRAIEDTLQASMPLKMLPCMYGGEAALTPIRGVQVTTWPPQTV